MRRDSAEELDFRVERVGGEAVVALSALTPAGEFRNGLAPKVRITRKDGSSSIVELPQIGAGSYRIRLPFERPQMQRFELLDVLRSQGQRARGARVRSLHDDFPDEYRSFPPDLGLLNTLADATGGKVAAPIAEIFGRQKNESTGSRQLWRWCALLGLLFYLLDIAARRTPLAWRWLGKPRPD